MPMLVNNQADGGELKNVQATFNTEIVEESQTNSEKPHIIIMGVLPKVDEEHLITVAKSIGRLRISTDDESSECTSFDAGITIALNGINHRVYYTAGHCLPNKTNNTKVMVTIDNTLGKISYLAKNAKSNKYPADTGLAFAEGESTSDNIIIEKLSQDQLNQLINNKTQLWQFGFPRLNSAEMQARAVNLMGYEPSGEHGYFRMVFMSEIEIYNLKSETEKGSSGGPIGYLDSEGQFHVIAVTYGTDTRQLSTIGYTPIPYNKLIDMINDPGTALIRLNLARSVVSHMTEAAYDNIVYSGRYDLGTLNSKLITELNLNVQDASKISSVVRLSHINKQNPTSLNFKILVAFLYQVELGFENEKPISMIISLSYNEKGETVVRLVKNNGTDSNLNPAG